MNLSSNLSICGITPHILLVMAVICSFILASAKNENTVLAPQQAEGLSWSVHEAGGEGMPESESSYPDLNPSCDQKQIVSVYRPTASPLEPFDPFTALPKVYPERFVPPQNL